MGAATSTLRDGGPYGGPYGAFRLTQEQQKMNQILSNLFQTLLQKNNLVDLSKIVSNDFACSEMILTLSNKLDKEFQTLRFPDPTTSQLVTTSFTSRDRYKVVQNDVLRQEMCKQIAHFLLRFVVLIAALTASISTAVEGETSLVEQRRIPQLSQDVLSGFPVRTPSQTILDTLVRSRFAEQLSQTVFRIGGKLYMDKKGYLYKNEIQTKVLGIEIGYKSSVTPSTPESGTVQGTSGLMGISQANYLRKEYERKFQEAQQSIQRNVQQKEFERQRQEQEQRARERESKALELQRFYEAEMRRRGVQQPPPGFQMGGVPPFNTNITGTPTPQTLSFALPPSKEYMYVRLYDQAKCGQGDCMVAEFYMDENGRCYTKEDVERTSGLLPVEYSVPFVTKAEQIFNKIPYETFALSKNVVSATANGDVETSFGFDETTVAYLRSFGDNYAAKKIYSPAAYRAFLLSSAADPGTQRIRPSFCKDAWGALKEIPAFNLLGALFTSPSGAVDPAYSTFLLTLGVEGGAFLPVSGPSLDVFCQAPREKQLLDKVPKSIVTDGFKQLQSLYASHLTKVVEFVKSILVVDQTFLDAMMGTTVVDATQPILRLDPAFLQSPAGSMAALENRIQAGRDLLTAHYTQVEKVYREALTKINAASGISATGGGSKKRRTVRRRPQKRHTRRV
jgi:hypothetical protein